MEPSDSFEANILCGLNHSLDDDYLFVCTERFILDHRRWVNDINRVYFESDWWNPEQKRIVGFRRHIEPKTEEVFPRKRWRGWEEDPPYKLPPYSLPRTRRKSRRSKPKEDIPSVTIDEFGSPVFPYQCLNGLWNEIHPNVHAVVESAFCKIDLCHHNAFYFQGHSFYPEGHKFKCSMCDNQVRFTGPRAQVLNELLKRTDLIVYKDVEGKQVISKKCFDLLVLGVKS